MNWIESFINGMISGLGMTVVMTIFGLLTFKIAKNWITKTVSEIWAKVRTEGLRLDGIQIEGKLKTKKIRRRED